MHDDDASTVNRMLIYLYSRDYSDGKIPLEQYPVVIDDSSEELDDQAAAVSLSSAFRSRPTHSRMINNLLVYAIACKYNLPSLKSLARSKFQASLESSPRAKLAPLISTMSKMTLASVAGVRDTLIQFCAENIEGIIQDSAVATIIKKDGEFLFSVFDEKRRLDTRALDASLASKALIEKEMQQTKSALSEATERERKAIEAKNDAIDSQMMAIKMKDSANDQIDRLIKDRKADDKGRERLAQDKNAIIRMKDDVINKLVQEKQKAVSNTDEALGRELLALRNKDFAIGQRTKAIKERDGARGEIETIKSSMKYFITQALEWKECRNCEASFSYGSYLQYCTSNELQVQLRCWNCRCRHDLGSGTF